MSDIRQTQGKTMYDYVVNSIMDMLIAKNPLFELQREKYTTEITNIYENYLHTNLINMLSESQYNEYQNLLTSNPGDIQKKYEYLSSRITNYHDEVGRLSEEFIQIYGNKISQM